MKPFASLLLPFLLVVCVPVPAAHAQAGAPQGGVMAEVDRLRANGRYAEALDALEAQQRSGTDDADVLWRMSRTRVDLGEQAPAAEQKAFYRAAMADAEAAVKAGPQNPDAHLALAIASGRVALVSGTREKIDLSRVVKESVDRAIALRPQDDAALHVRGRWHYEVADLGFFERAAVKVVYGGLPDASFEQAARDFERAVAVHDLIRHRVELAKAYVKLDQDEKARTQLEHALALPGTDADDPAYKQEARALLDDL